MSRNPAPSEEESLDRVAAALEDLAVYADSANQSLDRIATALEGLLDRQDAREDREREGRG